jgi:oligoendopeptidase F
MVLQEMTTFVCEMQSTINNILFIQGLLENLNDESLIETKYLSLIVIDDQMRDLLTAKTCVSSLQKAVITGISVLHVYCRTASQREKKTEP